MGFLAFLPILNTIIDRVFPDAEKQAEAKAQLMTIMAESDKAEWEAKSKVISAEASGESSAQRNWRPHLMYLFMLILLNNYIILPYMGIFGISVPHLDIPTNMWTLLEIGVGGYIVGRSGEKIASHFNDTAFFTKLRNKFKGLTQQQVDVLNEALNEGKK